MLRRRIKLDLSEAEKERIKSAQNDNNIQLIMETDDDRTNAKSLSATSLANISSESLFFH